MSGGVGALDWAIEAAAQQFAIAHHHRADGNFAGVRCPLRLGQRNTHPANVFRGVALGL